MYLFCLSDGLDPLFPPSPFSHWQLSKAELSIAAHGGSGVASGGGCAPLRGEPHWGVCGGCGEEGGRGCGGGQEGVPAVWEGAACCAARLLATRLKMVKKLSEWEIKLPGAGEWPGSCRTVSRGYSPAGCSPGRQLGSGEGRRASSGPR